MEARNKEERKRNTRLMMALCCCVLSSIQFKPRFLTSIVFKLNEKKDHKEHTILIYQLSLYITNPYIGTDILPLTGVTPGDTPDYDTFD